MSPSRRRSTRALGTVALLGVLCAGATAASADEQFDARLRLELTPDRPKARDDGSSSSPLNDQTAYRLEPLPAAESAMQQVSEPGLRALYWAVQHPRQAWRVLLPIEAN